MTLLRQGCTLCVELTENHKLSIDPTPLPPAHTYFHIHTTTTILAFTTLSPVQTCPSRVVIPLWRSSALLWAGLAGCAETCFACVSDSDHGDEKCRRDLAELQASDNVSVNALQQTENVRAGCPLMLCYWFEPGLYVWVVANLNMSFNSIVCHQRSRIKPRIKSHSEWVWVLMWERSRAD